jgi:outer membrane protein assembly factor BamB
MTKLIACVFMCAAGSASVLAANWPMYRADAARSGYTSEQLPDNPTLAWTYHPHHPPMPAWPRDDRMSFDLAPQVVVADGLLLFGSSADGRVIALDAAIGDPRWTFFTGAPVRFAPVVHADEVFVVSDDGSLYCLAAADGALQHQWRPGPSDEMILGNGRMVSRWTARGGPVVRDGVVYFAAGIWQSDGVFLQAIDTTTHEQLWQNETAGRIYMAQPHGGAMAESGISPQGYLVAMADSLLVPTGRAVPAAFARADGQFRYYHLQANGQSGGTEVVTAEDRFYNGGSAFQLESGALIEKLGPGNYAAMPGAIVCGTTKGLRVLSAVEVMAPDRKGVPVKVLKHQKVWWVDNVDASAAVIVAGDTIICGGAQTVTAVDATDRRVAWTRAVDGPAHGLAVSGGRIYVSTAHGTIYCFDGETHRSPVAHRFTPKSHDDERYASAATEIIERSGVSDGFCLDLNCGDGGLALALAHRTNLQIYALCPTAEEVAAVRKTLAECGVYGTRVTVHQGTPENHPYGKYFADLVVSARSLELGPLQVNPDNLPRVLRPFGGIICTGRLGAMQLYRRGRLAKSGSWTHQYSDLGNSSYSADELVQGELHALWFRDVDLEMPQRHGRGPAPLYHQGRLFVEGIDALRAVNAYNGRNLWEFSLPQVLTAYSADHLSGTAVTGSNLCLSGDNVYVHDKIRCYRLDSATGYKLAEFTAPPYPSGASGLWGYVACDGERLYGSLPNHEHRIRFNWRPADMSELWAESTTLFALDAETGELQWRYDAEKSIRHNAIAVGEGCVYLIDRGLADEDKLDPPDARARQPAVKEVNQPLGTLVALDSKTGDVVWKKPGAFGTILVYSSQYDALLMSYQPTRFKLPSEVGGRLAVYRGRSGEILWDKEANYVTRPFLKDDTVYAQGGAWNLLSGEDRPFELKRSYGCGQISASEHLMLFRSATLGYQSMTPGAKVKNFGGIRPGCWINALPVGGLVLVPDASAGCSCSYQNRSWMALEGDE